MQNNRIKTLLLFLLLGISSTSWSQQIDLESFCDVKSKSLVYTVELFYVREKPKLFVEDLLKTDFSPKTRHLIGIAYDALASGKTKAETEAIVTRECAKLNLKDFMQQESANDTDSYQEDICIYLPSSIVVMSLDEENRSMSDTDFLSFFSDKRPTEAKELLSFVTKCRQIFKNNTSNKKAEEQMHDYCSTLSEQQIKAIELQTQPGY